MVSFQNITIEVNDVSKRFYLHEHRVSSIRELFVKAFKRSKENVKKPYFCLQNISMSIEAGQTWAIIGSNGAGKSTLLRLIAGIYWPTSGEIITRGRIAAVIELAVGFHPELTGMENIFLYGSILGFNRKDISKLFTEIVHFSGIEEYLNMPIKYYSTGMRMRLGFAVATAIEPQILMLDEVFAIGDANFRIQCMEKITAFQNSGCSLVIATHDLEGAEVLATHAVWLDSGRVKKQGKAKEVISAYSSSF